MFCKFHALNLSTPMPSNPHLLTGLAQTVLALALAWPVGAWAEKADRTKPLVVESDGKQAAQADFAKHTTTVSGNVVISQGTLQIKADKVEIREDAQGRPLAAAIGSAAQPASFRQKRDRPDEYIEAEAQRIDYDGGADRVRFSGAAKMRLVRAGVVTDEASAAAIVYDQPSDTVTFEGGGNAPGAASAPSGRARLVFVPRNVDTAASAPPLQLVKPPAGDTR
jgi:lipopolysaccharide export system protein LptA